jgi:hypothetical protein
MENIRYMPIFRARQQELIVLNEFDFGDKIFPLVEIIKEKDRKNNNKSSFEIYSEMVENINSEKVFLDLPTYLHLVTSTNEEVVSFSRTTLEVLDQRIAFYQQFSEIEKSVPVISSLATKTGEANTIMSQFEALQDNFTNLAFRLFHNSPEADFTEVENNLRPEHDILIYDLDNIPITSPAFRVQRRRINELNAFKKIIVRSAIGNEIQNNTLDHGNVVGEADNSLIELYSTYHFDAFGDYVGIKKDDLTSGGTISPGLIFFDPTNNLYYGYKGEVRRLEEFQNTIVPSVLASEFIQYLQDHNSEYIDDNEAINTMNRILSGEEPGKSQAKFKKIAMIHYLHCIKTSFDNNHQIPML